MSQPAFLHQGPKPGFFADYVWFSLVWFVSIHAPEGANLDQANSTIG
jgi:hypothetical protein